VHIAKTHLAHQGSNVAARKSSA